MSSGADLLSEFRAQEGKEGLPMEAFLKLIRSPNLASFVNESIQRFLRDPSDELSLVDSTRLVLLQADTYTLFLSLQQPPSKHLYSHPFSGAVANLSGGSIAIVRYALPEGWDANLYAEDVRLRQSETQMVAAGEAAVFDGMRDVIDIRADGALLLKMFTHTNIALEWAFSRETLAPISAIAADPLASRTQYISRVLGEIGDESSTESLSLLLAHRDHYVRWSALQALGRVHPKAARAALARLTDDPHPHIRAAANREHSRLNQA